MLQTVPLFGAIPGGPEMLIILLVLVLLFGANKIPKLARSTGQAMGEFQKGREEVEDELQKMREGKGGEGETTGTTGTTETTESTESSDTSETTDSESEEVEETERNS